jgi:hypothetical protein
VIEGNWESLAPRLQGQIRIWVGESDEYFLNEAVHRLSDAMAKLEPTAGARFEPLAPARAMG